VGPFDLRWSWAVVLSLIASVMLTSIPLPVWITYWRPAWVALALIYWCIALPERIGVLTGWGIGILLDVLHGSLLGQHALGLAFVAFIAVLYHQRIRVFPLVQQAVVVGSTIFIYQAWLLMIYNTLGSKQYPNSFLLGALTSAVVWPWLFIVLRDLRRHSAP
jgi:rod shape-determining protein MreD